jgi:hypothetical protein
MDIKELVITAFLTISLGIGSWASLEVIDLKLKVNTLEQQSTTLRADHEEQEKITDLIHSIDKRLSNLEFIIGHMSQRSMPPIPEQTNLPK